MMNSKLYLHSFTPVLPPYQGEQKDLVDWILKVHARSMDVVGQEDSKRLIPILKRFCVSERQINRRHFECPDVYQEWNEDSIYDVCQRTPSGADIYERHLLFSKRAQVVFEKIYAESKIPQHLIHVTCTGYVSPSAPQRYFSAMENRPEITHAYHMGCYASLPAVRMAEAFVRGRNQTVDVVHTEMCSLHLNPGFHTPEQLVVQTLFADGHMKYSLDHKAEGRKLELLAVKEQIIPDSQEDMTWIPSATSMQMTLSKEVPEKIRGYLTNFLRELAQENNIELMDLLKNSLWAIHPGGPKIIDSIVEHLELSSEQVHFSRKVLMERGNMSSATLPHVWHEILKSDFQGRVISLAFGPGLTIFGGLFEVSS